MDQGPSGTMEKLLPCGPDRKHGLADHYRFRVVAGSISGTDNALPVENGSIMSNITVTRFGTGPIACFDTYIVCIH